MNPNLIDEAVKNIEEMKISPESPMSDTSNEIDIRDIGICPECQDKVVKAILGIKKDKE